MGRKRAAVLTAVLACVIALMSTARSGSAVSAAAAKTCPAGYVSAHLSWGDKCLQANEFCKVGNVEYHAYGFDCPTDGRLTDYAGPATTTASTTPVSPFVAAPTSVFRIDHVADGDTVDLTNGQRVRLVQVDSPEISSSPECYGAQAAAITRRLLPPGTRVRLESEPATDRVDRYGRLLRYVIRAPDGLNVNLRLVTVGAAAPYFYEGRRGRFAARLDALALAARALHRGLWGACPHTPFDPDRGVATRR